MFFSVIYILYTSQPDIATVETSINHASAGHVYLRQTANNNRRKYTINAYKLTRRHCHRVQEVLHELHFTNDKKCQYSSYVFIYGENRDLNVRP